MAKNFNNLFLMSRRTYSATVENLKIRRTAPIIRKVAAESSQTNTTPKEEVFWMRDPETGNWKPENHFGEVDVAELRHKLLPKRHY